MPLCLRLSRASLLSFRIVFSANAAPSQNDQRQINEQVWKPFARALVERDVDLYFSVHSPEIIRAELRASRVADLDAYRADMVKYWSRRRHTGAPADTLELQFTKRVSNGSAAYESGYCKSEFTRQDGKRGVYCGAFHVVLRKENDRWKILVDADGFDGPQPTEEIFRAAQPRELK